METTTIPSFPVRTESDYDRAINRINTLLNLNPEPGSREDDELEVLSSLVQVYEDNHYPILPPEPVEAVKIAMEEKGMQQKDLVGIIGPKSRVSELMNRKRDFTKKEIQALHDHLGIPYKVFFREVN